MKDLNTSQSKYKEISGLKWIIRGKSRSIPHYNRLKLPLEGKKAHSQLVKGGKIQDSL